MDSDTRDLIEVTVATARTAFELIWPRWWCDETVVPSTGNCIVSSHALCVILDQIVPTVRWRLAGGRGKQDEGGYCDQKGWIHAHCWVEGQRGHRRCVVDLTADQFGGPEIVVSDLPNPIYQGYLGHRFYNEFFIPPARDINQLIDAFKEQLEFQRT